MRSQDKKYQLREKNSTTLLFKIYASLHFLNIFILNQR